MSSKNQYKLPTLGAFLSKNEKAFNLARDAGMVQTMSWEEQEKLLRQEWHAMSNMDPRKLNTYLEQRHRRELPALQAMLEQINKMLGAKKAREKVGESLTDAKEQEAHAKRKRSA